jgi:photosystem II stability/assembly factor-like uncharacterized protein
MNIGRSHLAALLIAMLALFKYSCATIFDKAAYPARHDFPNVKVQFVDDRSGWIVGPGLSRTQDGGNTWKKIRLDGSGTVLTEVVDNEQRLIHFVDERLGFFLGKEWEIYKTVDGGDTWTQVDSLKVIDESERFHTIFFISPTKGWVIGKSVYQTNDGAVTWKRLNVAPIADDRRKEKPQVADGYPPAVAFLNERTLVLARKDGDVYRSEDGGEYWRRVWSVNNYLCNAFFLNEKVGWVVGANGFLGRTTDGGGSWEQIKVPTNAQFNDIFFLSDRKGWAVGRNGEIIYTTDGGTSWSNGRVPDEFRKNLVDVWFVDEKRGWAVGGEPFDDIKLFSQPTNLILETQDGGQSWFQRTL